MNKIYFFINNKFPLSVYEEDFILNSFSDIIFISDDINYSKNYIKSIFKKNPEIESLNDFKISSKNSIFFNDTLKYLVNKVNFTLANFNNKYKVVYSNQISNFITNEKLILNSNIIDINLYKKIKENYLDENRFLHALNVAFVSYKIALFQESNISFENIFLAGLVHDIAKDLEIKKQLDLAKNNQYYIECKDYALHQFAGAELYKKLTSDFDEEIYNSISFHCTGKDNMSLFEKIIFYADKYEPSRYLNNKIKSDKVVKSLFNSYDNFDSTFYDFVLDQIEYFKSKKYNYLEDKYANKFYSFELKK